jgi:DNA-binding XRE family transcriptional regulator
MSVAAKTRPISIRFKPRTPARVIHAVKKEYSNYILEESDESVDWFKTDLHKEISARMTPGKHLRALRELSSWTLAKTGEMVGVSVHRISDYESGRLSISKEVAKRLAKVFDVSPAVFI